MGEFSHLRGWIAPDGEFYGVEHGAHDSTAFILVETNPSLCTEFEKYCEENKVSFAYSEFLETKGWIRFHNPLNEMKPYPAKKVCARITKKQIETIYDLVLFFKLDYDPLKFLKETA